MVDITHSPLGYPLPKFSQSQGAPLVQAQEPQVPPGPQVPPAFAPIHTFVGAKEEFWDQLNNQTFRPMEPMNTKV